MGSLKRITGKIFENIRLISTCAYNSKWKCIMWLINECTYIRDHSHKYLGVAASNHNRARTSWLLQRLYVLSVEVYYY